MDIPNFLPLLARDPACLISDPIYRGIAEQKKMLWSTRVPETNELFRTVFLLERLEDALYPREVLMDAWKIVAPGGYLIAVIRGPPQFMAQNVKIKLMNLFEKKEWLAMIQELGGEIRLAMTVGPQVNPGQIFYYIISRKAENAEI